MADQNINLFEMIGKRDVQIEACNLNIGELNQVVAVLKKELETRNARILELEKTTDKQPKITGKERKPKPAQQ